MAVIDSLFTSQLQKDGSYSSWTLPAYASEFLAEIEQLFGPRNCSFTLTGIDIDKTLENPQIWFPCSGIPPNDAERRSRHVVIHLGSSALNNETLAKWQLAHECVHLLDPWHKHIDGPTNRLEEGLATWFQNSQVEGMKSHEGNYAEAEEHVAPLMDKWPNSIKCIRREQRLRIGEITPDVLRCYCPGLDEEALLKLCQPFFT